MQRLYTFDIAKAICIILVVIGHYTYANAPNWYYDFIRIIYTFHMPLFMFASGYIYMATKKEESYGSFIIKKLKRLMIPYFTTSILVITIKILTQSHAYMENPVTLYSYIRMFYYPEAGYFLWFIWALLWMFLIAPIFKSKKSRLCLLAISVVLAYIPIPATDILCIIQAKRMLVYFVSGIIVCEYKDLFKRFFSYKYLILTCFIALEFLYLNDADYPKHGFIYHLSSFFGIAAVIICSYSLSKNVNHSIIKALLQISASSYIIYLLHTTFQGFAKAIIHKLPEFAGEFYIGTLFVVLIGVIAPLILHKYILQRFRITRILFGLK